MCSSRATSAAPKISSSSAPSVPSSAVALMHSNSPGRRMASTKCAPPHLTPRATPTFPFKASPVTAAAALAQPLAAFVFSFTVMILSGSRRQATTGFIAGTRLTATAPTNAPLTNAFEPAFLPLVLARALPCLARFCTSVSLSCFGKKGSASDLSSVTSLALLLSVARLSFSGSCVFAFLAASRSAFTLSSLVTESRGTCWKVHMTDSTRFLIPSCTSCSLPCAEPGLMPMEDSRLAEMRLRSLVLSLRDLEYCLDMLSTAPLAPSTAAAATRPIPPPSIPLCRRRR